MNSENIFEGKSRREKEKLLPKTTAIQSVFSDDRMRKYIDFKAKGGEDQIWNNRPSLMWADYKLYIKRWAKAKEKCFIDEYVGYLYEEHKHHIVFKTKSGYDISVSKVDLYTGMARLERM